MSQVQGLHRKRVKKQPRFKENLWTDRTSEIKEHYRSLLKSANKVWHYIKKLAVLRMFHSIIKHTDILNPF